MPSETDHRLALAFADWVLRGGTLTTSEQIKERVEEYARRRKAGESHERILGLPEPVKEEE